MSVEITGPAGYEFQYLITSAIALQNLQCESFKVECESGEDAQLSVLQAGNIQIIDVQVKSANLDIDNNMLCGWLNHFTARRSDENLLSKILNNEMRIAVFVTAGRCCDESRQFIRHFGDFSHHPRPTLTFTKAVIHSMDLLAENMPIVSGLERARKTYSQSLVNTLKRTPALLRDALQRVIIWESTSADMAESLLTAELTRKCFIPLVCCDDTIRQLETAVRSARDSRSDVIPEVKKILAERSGYALLGAEPHDNTGQEDTLFLNLSQNRVLLLTGRSLCGKTNMAKFLAQTMQNEGVNATLGQDVDQAFRFLTVRHEEPRLFLLEDPFDRIYSPTEALRVQEVLRRLLGELPQHRFIIVTSKTTNIPAGVRTLPPHTWYDLTIQNPAFLTLFWHNRCAGDDLLASLEPKLDSGFHTQAPEELLQPGHLIHLSRLPNLEDAPFEHLCQLARFDILSLAHSLADRSPFSRRVHTALCLGASTIQQMSVDELKFILSESEERPSFSKSFGITYGGKSDKQFPEFPTVPLISNEDEHEIHLLERLGHIRVTSQGIEFTHPDYLAVSREILGSSPKLGLTKLLDMLERGLSSVSESTALLSSEITRIIYARYGEDQTNRQSIFEVACNARQSIFPAVRDAILQVLIGWLATLNEDARKQVLKYVGKVDYSFNEIIWQGEMPWTSSSRSIFDLMLAPDQPQDDKTDALLNSLVQLHSTTAISPPRAWELLHYIESNSASSQVLVEIMKQPYAFIRAKAIALLIERHMDEGALCIQLLYSEVNPGVVFAAIRTCFSQWQCFTGETRKQLIEWLISRLITTPIAVVCSDLLTDFGDSHSNYGPNWEILSDSQRQEVWTLWATLFPVYLHTVASQPFEHNASRMYNTLQVAMDQLGKPQFSSILEAWVIWVEGQLKIRSLDDFELPVAELLLKTEEPGERRLHYIKRLLEHCDTGFSVTTIDILIHNWALLTEDEKALLTQEIQNPRSDIRWLRAVAITRSCVPQEIQLLLTGYDDLLAQPSESIIEKMQPDLLSDALHVHCGKPQPLWWYGLHHKTAIPWREVLGLLADQPNHRDFDLALSEMFYFASSAGVNGWNDSLGIWRRVCESGGPDIRNHIFKKHILRESVMVNGPEIDGFWPALFEFSSVDEIIQYTTGIVGHLRSISLNVNNIVEFFGKNFFDQNLMPHLKAEEECLKFIRALQRTTSDESKRHQLTDFVNVIQENPPRVYQMFGNLERALKDITFQEAKNLRHAVEAARIQFLDKANEESDDLKEESKIEDWITSCNH